MPARKWKGGILGIRTGLVSRIKNKRGSCKWADSRKQTERGRIGKQIKKKIGKQRNSIGYMAAWESKLPSLQENLRSMRDSDNVWLAQASQSDTRIFTEALQKELASRDSTPATAVSCAQQTLPILSKSLVDALSSCFSAKSDAMVDEKLLDSSSLTSARSPSQDPSNPPSLERIGAMAMAAPGSGGFFTSGSSNNTGSKSPNASLSAGSSVGVSSTKVGKKRSRASRRPPTTILEADTGNFRAMVQQLTGIPGNPPFVSNPSLHRGRLDHLLTSGLVRPQPTRPLAFGMPNLPSIAPPLDPSALFRYNSALNLSSQNLPYSKTDYMGGLDYSSLPAAAAQRPISENCRMQRIQDPFLADIFSNISSSATSYRPQMNPQQQIWDGKSSVLSNANDICGILMDQRQPNRHILHEMDQESSNRAAAAVAAADSWLSPADHSAEKL